MRSHLYLLITLGFYAVGALYVFVHAITRRTLLSSWTVTAILAGFAVHTAGLSQRWTEAGHFPAVGVHDLTSLLAWAMVLVFLGTYLRTRVDALGLVVYPAAFALLLVANLTQALDSGNPILHSLFLPIHTTLAALGYAALFVGFAMGLLYLIQEAELKSGSPRAFYYLAPSLERCDTIAGWSLTVGFGLLTLAIITGLFWSREAYGRYWSGDAKEWSSLLAWAIYVVMLVARHRTGWGGRRAALLGIVGFTVVVFTFVSMTTIADPVRAVR